jgi:carbon storage regulator
MLVVTRKKDEKLIIGDDIEIQVLRVGRDNVRLGIKAPPNIPIYRYEIYEAIKAEHGGTVPSQASAADAAQASDHSSKPEE